MVVRKREQIGASSERWWIMFWLWKTALRKMGRLSTSSLMFMTERIMEQLLPVH